MTKQFRDGLKKRNPNFKPVKKYKDKKGRARYHGTKQLTSTQKLGRFGMGPGNHIAILMFQLESPIL